MPFVVVSTSVEPFGAPFTNSRGELPKSKPSIFTQSRSPASAAPPAAADSSRASSTSPAHRTRSYPPASAWQIVDVARSTSITIPTGADTSSAGVKATWTRTRLG